jgi:beta-N-acetylhexosaminidase
MIENQLNRLKENTQELFAQLIFARLNIDDYLANETYKNEIQDLVSKGIGGFCVFRGSAEDTFNVIKELKPHSQIPLLFSGDYENGITMRHTSGTELPHAMALGLTNNQNIIAEAAKIIAEEAKQIGVNWIYAPVVDVNSNKQNPIINVRAYGEDTTTVVNATKTVIEEFSFAEVLSCAKHFPGHGDTLVDSHLDLPVLDLDKERLHILELQPFISAIENKVDSIMVAHLALPKLDNSNLPASLSKVIITDLLKKELGYKGIVLTDALEMNAISKKYKSDEAVVLALEAGNDILLMPEDNNLALSGLLNKKDELYNLALNAVEKILHLKEKLGLFDKAKYLRPAKFKLEVKEEQAFEIAKGTINVSKFTNEFDIRPKIKIAGFAHLQNSNNFEKASFFFNFLQQAFENDIDFAYFDENAEKENIEAILASTKDADVVINAVFYRSRAYSGTIGENQSLFDRIEKLTNYNPVANFYFGNPYLAEQIKQDIAIFAYSDAMPSIAASVLQLKQSLKG